MSQPFPIPEIQWDFGTAYEAFRRDVDLKELDLDPDEVYADVRDSSPGRDFNW